MGLKRSSTLIALATLSVIGSAAYYYIIQRKVKDFNDEPNEKEASVIQNAVQSAKTEEPSANERVALALAEKNRGNKYYNDKKFSEAVKCYSAAISLYPPNHPELALAYANRAACNLSLKQYDSVIEDCSQALQIDSKFIKALDRRSKAYEMLLNYEEAITDCTTACFLDDFKNNSLIIRIETLLKEYSTTQAKALSKREYNLPSKWMIKEFISTFPSDFQKLNAYLSLKTNTAESKSASNDLLSALRAIVNGQYNEASKLLEKLRLNLDGFSKEEELLILNWSCVFNFLKGDMETSLEICQKASLLPNCYQTIAIKQALVFLEMNDFERMISSFSDAFGNLSEADPASLYHRAEVMALMNNMEMATQDFKACIDIYPSFISAHIHLARCLIALNKIDEALDVVEKAVKRFPDNFDLKHSRAETFVLQAKFDEANQIFNDILDSPSAEACHPQVYLSLALSLLKHSNDRDGAIAQLLKAVEIDPAFQAAHLQLAQLLLMCDDIDGASKHFDSALKYARSGQELESVLSLKAASIAQAKVAQRHPDLAAKIGEMNKSNF